MVATLNINRTSPQANVYDHSQHQPTAKIAKSLAIMSFVPHLDSKPTRRRPRPQSIPTFITDLRPCSHVR